MRRYSDFAIASMANVAQGAATLAVFLCAHEGKLKGLAGASAASALMGITEPAIFGVNLRLRWPFFIGIGSAAVGGALVSIFNVKAIALGAAGHSSSNPVEARRLIAELLAGQHDLTPQEVSLANAFLREFDARVALYADLARQREESERQVQSMSAEEDRRYSALNAETQRLKKALADAESKLEAVAEMERTLTPESQ